MSLSQALKIWLLFCLKELELKVLKTKVFMTLLEENVYDLDSYLMM